MPNLSLVQQVTKAAMGLFSQNSATQMQGMLQGIFPSGGGETPERGTQQQIEAYNLNPWLRAATGRIATSVAATSNGWQLFAPTSKKKRDVVSLQRGPVEFARKAMIKKKLETGDLEPIEDHILLDSLAAANNYHVGLSLFKLTQLHLDLVGEAFWGLERNGLGAPVAFWPIPSHWIKETPTPQDPVYKISFRGWQASIPDKDMIWMAEPNPANPYARGTGNARALADELELDEYAAKHMKQFFYNRARPDLIVFPKQTGPQDTGLRSAEVDRLEESWLTKHTGLFRAFKPFFVGREIGVHEVGQDFKSMEMNELRTQQRNTVLQQFGIPPEQLGIIENSNRATISASDFLFNKNVIVPRMEFLRAQLQERLVPMYDERLVLDYISPIEEDKEHTLAVAVAMPSALTIDEWRQLMDKEPLEDDAGDIHPVKQVTFVRDLGEEADKEPDPVLIPGLPGEPPIGEHRPGSLLQDPDDDDDKKPPPKKKPKDDDDDEKAWLEGSDDDYAVTKEARQDHDSSVDDDGDPLPPLSARVGRHERTRRQQIFLALDELPEKLNEDQVAEALRGSYQVDRVISALPHYDAWLKNLEDEHSEMAEQAFWIGLRMAASDFNVTITRSITKASDVQFNKVNPRARDYARERSGLRIQAIDHATRESIREVLVTSLNEGWGAEKTARMLRGSVSLTRHQSIQMNNLAERLQSAGKLTGRRLTMARRRMERTRALTIARTELIAASNAGQQALWQEGIASGAIRSDSRRTWITAVDGSQDIDCEVLNGTVVGMNEEFRPGVLHPPLHPNCRCAIGLVDGRVDRMTDKQLIGQSTSFYDEVVDGNSSTLLGRHLLSNNRLTLKRQRLHDAIVRQHMKGIKVARNPQTTVLGGGPASGKSTMLDKIGGIPKNTVVADPDAIRVMFPEYKDGLLAKNKNIAAFSHSEASMLAKRVAREATQQQFNLVMDGTGNGSFADLAAKIKGFRQGNQGRRIVGQYVSIDTDEAVRRAIKRAKKSGREVPEEYMRGVHKALSETIPEALEKNLFDEFTLYDNTLKDNLVTVLRQTGGKPPVILNQAAYDRFLAKAFPDVGQAARSAAWPLADDVVRGAKSTVDSLDRQLSARGKQWVESLDEAERNAFRKYTGFSHRDINKFLRGERDITWSQETFEQIRDAAKGMRTAFERAPKPPPPELTWRGIGSNSNLTSADFPVGHRFEWKGYQSTTIDPGVAKRFTGNGSLVFEIQVSEGAWVRQISEFPTELEFLLPTGMRYEVVGIKRVDIWRNGIKETQEVVQVIMQGLAPKGYAGVTKADERWREWPVAENPDEVKFAAEDSSFVTLAPAPPPEETDDDFTRPKMSAQELGQMLADVTNGVPAPEGEDLAHRRVRLKMTEQVDAIKARGKIVDVPSEIADVTGPDHKP